MMNTTTTPSLSLALKTGRHAKRRQTSSQTSSRSAAGFTLMEMMIVIAIIALIGGIVGSNIMKKFEESKVQAARVQIKQLGVVLDDFRRVCGFYPSTDQGLEALVKPPTGGRVCKNYDPEGFIRKIPQDPWQNDYLYESTQPTRYLITSMGPDQTADSAKKITSDNLD